MSRGERQELAERRKSLLSLSSMGRPLCSTFCTVLLPLRPCMCIIIRAIDKRLMSGSHESQSLARSALPRSALHCTALHYTALYYTALHGFAKSLITSASAFHCKYNPFCHKETDDIKYLPAIKFKIIAQELYKITFI